MKKIVWISSYPKSGNTFLRAMLSAFFYSKDGTFKQDYLKNISEFPRDFFDFKPKNNFLNEVKEYEKMKVSTGPIENNLHVQILQTECVEVGNFFFQFFFQFSSVVSCGLFPGVGRLGGSAAVVPV